MQGNLSTNVAGEILEEVGAYVVAELDRQEAALRQICKRIITADISIEMLPPGKLWWYTHPLQTWRACWRFNKALMDARNEIDRCKYFHEWLERLNLYLCETEPFCNLNRPNLNAKEKERVAVSDLEKLVDGRKSRGAPDSLFRAALERMRSDVVAGRFDLPTISSMGQVALAAEYGVSRGTATKARQELLSNPPQIE